LEYIAKIKLLNWLVKASIVYTDKQETNQSTC